MSDQSRDSQEPDSEWTVDKLDMAPPGRWAASGLLTVALISTSACEEPRPATAGVVGATTPRTTCNVVPAPRWVLRDNDGKAIRALVEPRCGTFGDAESWARCLPLDFGSSSGFPCVRVIDHQDRYVNLEYDLLTGQIGPCHGGDFADIDADWSMLPSVFVNEQCQGERFLPVDGGSGYHNPEFTRPRELLFGLGQLWYPAEEGCLPDTVPSWYNSIDTCKMYEKIGLCPLVPVPEWVINLLPNPPYSLAVEYE
jgi:hypothetical protein